MAEIHELINRVDEPELRAQLQAAVDKLAKQKKFGLVFEEHLPECTPLYDVPVKKGRMAARKKGEVSQLYVILKISDDVATCVPKNGGDVVGRAQFIREIKVAGKSKFKRLDFSKGDVRKKVLKAINTDELDHIFDEHGKVE